MGCGDAASLRNTLRSVLCLTMPPSGVFSTTALRRFSHGGVLRRWGNPMGDGGRWGEATADGGEVAYLWHAEFGVEENPGTLRCALHTGLRKSAVALRRESANRGMTFLQPLFGGFSPMAMMHPAGMRSL